MATEDEIKEQLRLDKEIRTCVTSLLSHQVAYEQGVASRLSSIQTEEKELASALGEFESTHQMDINSLVRLSVYLSILDTDVSDLQDTATSRLTGSAPGRLSASFSAHSGMQSLLAFKLMDVRPWTRASRLDI